MRIPGTALIATLALGCGGGSSASPPRGDSGVTADDLSTSNKPQPDLASTETPDLSSTMQQGPDMTMQCSVVTTLHAPKAMGPTIFCPFAAMGMPLVYCQAGMQHCCEPTMGMSACDPIAMACPVGDTDWQCQDPVADCPQGMKCCGTGTLDISPDPSCGNYATGFQGTHCAASCTANEIEMCTNNSECSGGQTCTPFGNRGVQVGGCH
jgi:hypothetical protein